MIVIGLSPTVHNSAVCLLENGRLVAAAAEERFSRIKNDGGFPHQALRYVMEQAGVEAKDVDAVAYAALPFAEERLRDLQGYVSNFAYVIQARGNAASRARHLANSARGFFRNLELPRWGQSQRGLVRALSAYGLGHKLIFVDHHRSHCAAAYYASGFDRCLAVSLDGYGSAQAGAFFLGERGKLSRLSSVPYPHSLGTFYRRVTQALGFKPNRHEGKIVGLAAHGDPERLAPLLRERFDLQHPDYYRIISGQDPVFDRQLASKYPREDVAAAYQTVLEEVVVDYVGRWVKRTSTKRIACAGGVFANVKMNQRLLSIPGIEELFVFPAMGDDGVGVGAAYTVQAEAAGLQPERLPDVYLGPGYDASAIRAALQSSELTLEEHGDVEAAIVDELCKNRVVARFDGRMEFGPRALGNRSLLYPATDPTVNSWLNQRLKRTEFMPFAPVTLAEHAAELYDNVEAIRYTSEFMTVTTNCKDKMREVSPAAVHVDGTARPQLVTPASNPSLHRLLTLYHGRTGIPTLINTSFNMHEEPIVCSPQDAIRAVCDGELEVLAMGSFIAKRKSQGERCQSSAA